MSKMLLLRIAIALLTARLKQSLVAAIGVTFSIAMFIALLSFMTGLNDLLDGLILNRSAHIRLYNEVKPSYKQPIQQLSKYNGQYHFIRSIKSGGIRQEIYNSPAVLEALSNDKRVIGTAPRITAQVFFNDGAIDITGVVNGIDVRAETAMFHFKDYMVGGSASDIDRIPNSIILGKGLAAKLLADIGDMVQITTAKGEIFPLKVVGFFQTGIMELDKIQSYSSVITVQKLLGKSANYVTDIQIKIVDITTAPVIAKEYATLFETDAEDIQTANAQFETGSFVRSLISYAVGITLLVVAGFGIYNILNMMIYEKMDSIAILKATGFSGLDVQFIFLIIALVIGITGGFFGLLLGLLISMGIDQIPFNTASLPTVKTYPVNYNPLFYAIGAVFSLVTTFFTGWFPSRKAGKADPVIIIRGK